MSSAPSSWWSSRGTSTERNVDFVTQSQRAAPLANGTSSEKGSGSIKGNGCVPACLLAFFNYFCTSPLQINASRVVDILRWWVVCRLLSAYLVLAIRYSLPTCQPERVNILNDGSIDTAVTEHWTGIGKHGKQILYPISMVFSH